MIWKNLISEKLLGNITTAIISNVVLFLTFESFMMIGIPNYVAMTTSHLLHSSIFFLKLEKKNYLSKLVKIDMS